MVFIAYNNSKKAHSGYLMLNRKVILTYALDDIYIYPFLVSSFSAYKIFQGNLQIELIQPVDSSLGIGMSEEGIKFCEKVFSNLGISIEVTTVDVSKSIQEIESLPVWSRFPRTTWLRFFAFYYEFEERNQNIFYLDPDTLFFKVDTNWFDVLDSTEVIAARSTWGHETFENDYGLRKSENMGGYFNGGVMVVNPINYSREYPERDWWECIKFAAQREFSIIDQDALNLLIRGKQEWLSIDFNTYPDEFDPARTLLIHFAGGVKPWLYPSSWERARKTSNAKLAFKLWDETATDLENSIEDEELSSRLEQYAKYVKPTFSRRAAQLFPGLSQKAWKIRELILKSIFAITRERKIE